MPSPRIGLVLIAPPALADQTSCGCPSGPGPGWTLWWVGSIRYIGTSPNVACPLDDGDAEVADEGALAPLTLAPTVGEPACGELWQAATTTISSATNGATVSRRLFPVSIVDSLLVITVLVVG